MKKLVIEIPCDEANAEELRNEALQLLEEWLIEPSLAKVTVEEA